MINWSADKLIKLNAFQILVALFLYYLYIDLVIKYM